MIAQLNDMGIAVYEQTPDAETLLINNNVATAATEAEAEEEAEVEDEAEEEEELEEDFELVELEYKGTTYYRDEKTNKVYLPDDDGAIDPEQPLGIWNLQTKKIQRLS